MREEQTKSLQIIEPSIIYEDENVLVINKPSGWIVNEADTTTTQPVIETWIKKNFQFSIFDSPECRAGIVHRIDKETSGCLIIAKDSDSFFNLQSQFKERIVQKKYIALVHGKVESDGEIDEPVGRLPWRRDRFGVLAGGRDAYTSYSVLKYLKHDNDDYTLIEVFPKTGRTHQIRIHFKYIGHPLVSDNFYAGRKTSRKDRQWCPRLFLHSSYIEFTQPVTQTRLKVEAPLPPDLEKAVMTLS